MKKSTLIALIAASALCTSIAIADDSKPIFGFKTDNATKERHYEEKFDSLVDTRNLDQWMKRMTAKPHHLGSAYDKDNAEWMAGLFKSWGYETEIVQYHVLMPTPKVRQLTMISPEKFKASLSEDSVTGDSTSDQADRLPTYVAYSPDGDVTAEVVFVNQGLKADYEDLKRRGIDVKGKIILAKYGGSWRGIKPKLAEEMGVTGVLMYSDPEDDGYYVADTYPNGPMKHASGAQRGSILDLPMRPGDPLTPYQPAHKEAKRLAIKDVEVFVKVPTLPISYTDALPILKALGGPVAPNRWRGALPLTYHMGPGPAKVHLKLAFNWDIVPLYNVIAKLEGSTYPDEWVMRGNHHDAWVHGAADPVSGMVSTMEEARIIGKLAKEGSRPKRTIIYAGWDGEEQGLIGSVEWVEEHAAELKEKLVAYINTDGTGRGFLNAGGSHTLEVLMQEISDDVDDPIVGGSVRARRLASRKVRGDKKAFDDSRFHLSALGSGSDYSGFFQHLGVPALNLGFGGESSSGSYHTNYDSYDHFTRFKDIDFKYGGALTKVAGRATLRLANADMLPFEFSRFAETVEGYAKELQSATKEMRADTVKHNQLVATGAFTLSADPTKVFVAPEKKHEVPYLNFAPIDNALAALSKAAKTLTDLQNKLQTNNYIIDSKKLTAANKLAYQAEQLMTEEQGLPRRPWFRHHVYAPGFYTGYGVKTLPGVREAIEERQYGEAQIQIDKLAKLFSSYTDNLNRINSLLK